MSAKQKADHLVETFRSKYKVGEVVHNDYTRTEPATHAEQREIGEVTEKLAEDTLEGLSKDSATGPDQLPTRILKECAKTLVLPLQKLVKTILDECFWAYFANSLDCSFTQAEQCVFREKLERSASNVTALEGGGENDSHFVDAVLAQARCFGTEPEGYVTH